MSQNALLFCLEHGTPAGSEAHYSLLLQPLKTRRRLAALYALREELDGLCAAGREPEIVQRRLDWWQEEVGRWKSEATPQHPVGLELSEAPLPVKALEGLLQATRDRLAYDVFPTQVQLDQHLSLEGGSFAHLLAAQTTQAAVPETFVDHAGITLLMIERLQSLGADLAQGRCIFPEDMLHEHGVTLGELFSATVDVRPLARAWAEQAREHWDRALQALPDKTERRQQTPLLIRLALALTVLKEIEADDYIVLNQRLTLTPLRRFWIAWRSVRQARRGRHLFERNPI